MSDTSCVAAADLKRYLGLLTAVAGYLVVECKRCSGSGKVIAGVGSDRTVGGVRYAGEVLSVPCTACAAVREALKL